MAKNTNPLTKSLLIKQNWNSIALPIRHEKTNNTLFQDLFINKLIHGIFYKFGLLTSTINYSRTCNQQIQVKFFYYPLTYKNIDNNFNSKILLILKLIKLILNYKYPKKHFKFFVINAPHKFVDSKILNDFVNIHVVENPSKIKFVINNLIREFKQISRVTPINSMDKFSFSSVNQKVLAPSTRRASPRRGRLGEHL